MARGIGDVLDAYFAPYPRAGPTPNMLVPLERDGWVASAVAVRLIGAVSAPGAEIAIRALDPQARALVGSAAPRARGGPVRVNAWFATTASSIRPNFVLSVVPAAGWSSRWAALDARSDVTAPAAAIGLVEAGTDSAGLSSWLATIPERAAIRIALGARPCEALNRAALALEHWLQAALPHASGPSAGWSGAASSAPGAFSPAQERTRVTFLVTPTPEAVTIRSG
jgi:hypothetical protein